MIIRGGGGGGALVSTFQQREEARGEKLSKKDTHSPIRSLDIDLVVVVAGGKSSVEIAGEAHRRGARGSFFLTAKAWS